MSTSVVSQRVRMPRIWGIVKAGLLPAAAAGLLGLAAYHAVTTSQAPPQLPPPVVPGRTPFAECLAGPGIVEPETENIAVGSPLSGVVHEVAVAVGARVEPGDLLFRLDDRQWKAELAVREATLASEEMNLQWQEKYPRPEEIPPSEARVAEARARLTGEEDKLARTIKLVDRKATSEADVVRDRQNVAMARAQLDRAEAEHKLLLQGTWGPALEVARSAVAKARVQVEQARTELARHEIRAPVAGEVLQVNVRPGEYVATPAANSPIILGDLSHIHVRVDIDEHDIPRFRPQSPARGFVRGAQEEPFALRFVRVEPYVIPKRSLTGGNTERVDTRVLQVIYAVENPEARLFVGQQIDAFIEQPEKAGGKRQSLARK